MKTLNTTIANLATEMAKEMFWNTEEFTTPQYDSNLGAITLEVEGNLLAIGEEMVTYHVQLPLEDTVPCYDETDFHDRPEIINLWKQLVEACETEGIELE